MLRPWREVAPGDGPAILTSVTEDEAARLGELAAGRRVLEVGSARGYSAVVMALAGAQTVYAIDDHNGGTWLGNTHAAMVSNLAAYGVLERVIVICDRSEACLPALVRADARFGLVFVDGDHTFEAVTADVENGLALLEPGGTLACHDYGEDNCPGVAAALDRLFPSGPDRVTGTLFEVTP